MKYRILLVAALLFIYASSCKDDDDDELVPFNHVAQAQKDNDSLVKYMETHFLDLDGELKEITGSETPVYTQITTQLITKEMDGVDIEYSFYYLPITSGINEYPTKVDSVHVSYKGLLLDDEVFTHQPYGTWQPLYSVIDGWKHGITHLKTGDVNVLPDSSFEFDQTGKQIIFIPSGLAYADNPKPNIPSSSPLIFHIELNMLRRTDSDQDSILSMYEDIDNDTDYEDDDTDGDNKPNFFDADDDGDGTLTKDENPDPNGDGNPSDAIDTDGDGTPDYLDPDNS